MQNGDGTGQSLEELHLPRRGGFQLRQRTFLENGQGSRFAFSVIEKRSLVFLVEPLLKTKTR